MVEIECHLCGEKSSHCVLNNFDGEVKCPNCEAILHVKLAEGELLKRKVVDRGGNWMLVRTPDDLELLNRRRKEIMEEEKKLLEKDSPKPPESMGDRPTKE